MLTGIVKKQSPCVSQQSVRTRVAFSCSSFFIIQDVINVKNFDPKNNPKCKKNKMLYYNKTLYKKLYIQLTLLILFTFFVIPASYAFKISPFKMYLSSKGNLSRGNFLVDNNTEYTKAINVYILRRDMDEDAQEINEEIGGEFTVYPSQLILRPGEKQDVKIQYLGNADIQHELAYRLIAEELPLDFVQHKVTEEEYKAKPNGGLGISLMYKGSLYVSPVTGTHSPRLQLNDYKYDMEENIIIADIANIGTRHIVLKDTMLQLHLGGSQKQWPGDAKTYISSINMLAGYSAKLKIPLGDEKFDDITIKLTP